MFLGSPLPIDARKRIKYVFFVYAEGRKKEEDTSIRQRSNDSSRVGVVERFDQREYAIPLGRSKIMTTVCCEQSQDDDKTFSRPIHLLKRRKTAAGEEFWTSNISRRDSFL